MNHSDSLLVVGCAATGNAVPSGETASNGGVGNSPESSTPSSGPAVNRTRRGVRDRIGDAPIVLLGESSHGTQDFYAARASLSRKLIEQKDFAALAVESDWPDAYRVNRFVHGQADLTAHTALAGFERFPTWVGLGFARRAQARSTRVGRQFRAALSRSPSTAFFCRSNQIPGFMKRCARPDSNARSG